MQNTISPQHNTPNKAAFLCILFLFSFISVHTCFGQTEVANEKSKRKIKRDTIDNLSDFKRDSTYWKHHGVVTLVSYTVQLESTKRKSKDCSEQFTGEDRKEAKTTYAKGRTKSYDSIGDLLKKLKPDSLAKKLVTDKSPRASFEKHNVKIDTAYLYSLKHEEDNDYHLIIGDIAKTNLFNCELSALPVPKNKYSEKIKIVRDSVVNQLGLAGCKFPRYIKFEPPLCICIEGSIFFDDSHSSGGVGPSELRPDSAWEIHPIKMLKIY
jgi:hypothetical protein